MKVRISGFEEGGYADTRKKLTQLAKEASGPLRCEIVWEKKADKPVKYLRSRTWGEYFYERLFASKQKIIDAENKANAAIVLAFELMLNRARQKEENSRKEAMPDKKVAALRGQDVVDNDDDNAPLATDATFTTNKLEAEVKQLQARVFEEQPTSFKNAGRSGPGLASDVKNIKSVNGLFQVPPGVSVCAASPLQFIADMVIVGSATDKSTARIEENMALKRAVSAFEKARAKVKVPFLPITIRTEGGKAQLTVAAENLPISDGLHHIQRLKCIADNKGIRGVGTPLDNEKINSDRWKGMYLALWSGAKGSVVQELYPNRWDGCGSANARQPIYSDANIQGAVAAALEISALARKDGEAPVSVMLTAQGDEIRQRLADEIRQRMPPPERPTIPDSLPSDKIRQKLADEIQRQRMPPLERPRIPDDLPTPEKLARNKQERPVEYRPASMPEQQQSP